MLKIGYTLSSEETDPIAMIGFTKRAEQAGFDFWGFSDHYHPAIVAQAAATSQYQLDGRFFWGVGAGENLIEHIVGKGWPPAPVRLETLKSVPVGDDAEAILKSIKQYEKARFDHNIKQKP